MRPHRRMRYDLIEHLKSPIFCFKNGKCNHISRKTIWLHRLSLDLHQALQSLNVFVVLFKSFFHLLCSNAFISCPIDSRHFVVLLSKIGLCFDYCILIPEHLILSNLIIFSLLFYNSTVFIDVNLKQANHNKSSQYTISFITKHSRKTVRISV